MVNLNKNKMLFLALFAVALMTAGCAKPECITSSDCLSKTCTSSQCQSGKCTYIQRQNCCGNNIKESIEDGKPGNQCTCPADYGKCEGKAKIKMGARTEDAAYVRYVCSADNQCALGVEKDDVVPQNFLDSINAGFFKASLIEKYNKPFDIKKDSFEFKITLDDSSKDLILPVKLSNIKLLYSSDFSRSELLIAEKDIESMLNGIGDQEIVDVPLTLSYKPQELEESGAVRYTIDYSYKKQVAGGRGPNGTTLYTNETVRSTFTGPSKPVFLVRSG